jgi:hypothetical protein
VADAYEQACVWLDEQPLVVLCVLSGCTLCVVRLHACSATSAALLLFCLALGPGRRRNVQRVSLHTVHACVLAAGLMVESTSCLLSCSIIVRMSFPKGYVHAPVYAFPHRFKRMSAAQQACAPQLSTKGRGGCRQQTVSVTYAQISPVSFFVDARLCTTCAILCTLGIMHCFAVLLYRTGYSHTSFGCGFGSLLCLGLVCCWFARHCTIQSMPYANERRFGCPVLLLLDCALSVWWLAAATGAAAGTPSLHVGLVSLCCCSVCRCVR